MTDDMIRYDLLAQDALRGVVRKVLVDAARHGLPGQHHFYIAFDTNYPGVSLSARMREQYPNEMTIVLQHQFWDLAIGDHAFEVGLSFGNVPERLVIPFDAVKGFFDPSVQFGLQFEIIDLDEDEDAEDEDEYEVELEADDGEEGDEGEDKKSKKGRAKMTRDKGRKALPKGAGSEPQALPASADLPQIKPKAKRSGKKGALPQGPGADIVSLDKFRKPKN